MKNEEDHSASVGCGVTMEQKFICIHNAVYMLEQFGFKCRQQAVEVIKNANADEQTLNELFVRSAKLLEITSRETMTYKDAMSRASDWVDTKNSILRTLGGCNG